MLNIYNLKDKQEYIKEVAELAQKEWVKLAYSKEELSPLYTTLYVKKFIILIYNEVVLHDKN